MFHCFNIVVAQSAAHASRVAHALFLDQCCMLCLASRDHKQDMRHMDGRTWTTWPTWTPMDGRHGRLPQCSQCSWTPWAPWMCMMDAYGYGRLWEPWTTDGTTHVHAMCAYGRLWAPMEAMDAYKLMNAYGRRWTLVEAYVHLWKSWPHVGALGTCGRCHGSSSVVTCSGCISNNTEGRKFAMWSHM
jgi:hypothetical protein